jgi:hypothetical protein
MARMTTHPVRLATEPGERLDRVHVAVRLALLLALAAIGCSSLYWLLYLSLPALVALLISSKGPERYLAEDGPRLVRALRWLAGAYAYLWLLTDAFPTGDGDAAVQLEVETGGAPTMGSALLRLVYSLPALLLLAILSFAATILWIIGAIAILVTRRLPRAFASFFAVTLQFQFRLAAYHLSLVERYPSLAETPPLPAAHSGAA